MESRKTSRRQPDTLRYLSSRRPKRKRRRKRKRKREKERGGGRRQGGFG